MKQSQLRKIRRGLFGNHLALALTVLGLFALFTIVMGGGGIGAVLGTVGMLAAAGVVLPEAEFQAKVLGATDDLAKKIGELETAHKTGGADMEKLKEATNAVSVALAKFQAEQASLKRQLAKSAAKRGHVSEEMANHLGALTLLFAIKGGQLDGKKRDSAEGIIKDILGIEVKTALNATDIPLPVGYSGEIVELVGQFGSARQYGTVYPLGDGTLKLPSLKTDPTFGLIAASGTVTEKSPQTQFVQFAAEKFGGLIRMPSEIEADSVVAMGQFLARYAARQLAYIEDYQFFISTGAGSGSNGSVKGLVESTITNSKVVQMASTKTHYSDATLANLRTLRTVCDAAALRMGAYYCHPSFEQLFASLNTSGDKPYQANGVNGATLDGFPIRFVDVMPAYSTAANVSKVFVLFGDASFQYLGVRGGIRFDTSREAGFTTDEVLVRALERFTIGLMATGSMGGLQTAAS